ncbi:MAG: hypothetical protein K0R93_2325 [Anaerosolibacter sp.]|jgi:hypothetical protein|nr:hypothetical protein [Anaerosolibacter sp.]MDF2547427.1 hypothetical protein [Anaerosolibacter sp.]
MKVSKKSPRNASRAEFSKEFLSEFGLVPNKHEMMVDRRKEDNMENEKQ